MNMLEHVTFRCKETRNELVATLGPRQLALFTSYERDMVLREELMRANGKPPVETKKNSFKDDEGEAWPEPVGWEEGPKLRVRGMGAKYAKKTL